LSMQKSIVEGPIVLAILDGWGIAPESESNPITSTALPTFDSLFKEGKTTQLWAHGEYVGLPKDQDGNSEAGHLNLGAGRIVKQDPVIINDAIRDGTFFKNPAFMEAIKHTKRNNSQMHLMGMLSDGQSAHATPEHLYALLELMEKEKVEKVFLHLFADGRDSAPHIALTLAKDLLSHMRESQKIATVAGRFYAMDRKKEWSRTELMYNALMLGIGIQTKDVLSIFESQYAEGKSDEYIEPHVVMRADGSPVAVIDDNDSIIFFNHRSDRARQLTKPFVQDDFIKMNPGSFIPKKRPKNLRFVAMTDFGPDLGDSLTAFPSVDVGKALPAILKEKRQLYVAEAEKYAHMTYFFNGGYADPVGGEDRLMVPSPNVRRYDKTPAMSTKELTNVVVRGLTVQKYDFIGVNFACLDMVAHTGNFKAAQESLKAVDYALEEIKNALLNLNGALVVTADHGNIEEMKNLSTGELDTEHSKNRVPFIIWCPGYLIPDLRAEGILADVAPTILDLFGINKPEAMTGKSLFKAV